MIRCVRMWTGEDGNPQAKRGDWREAVAGQRVQAIKLEPNRSGALEFGTEIVASNDGSIVALLGASPGASTAASIAIDVLEKCLRKEITADEWLERLRDVTPSYEIDLKGRCRMSGDARSNGENLEHRLSNPRAEVQSAMFYI